MTYLLTLLPYILNFSTSLNWKRQTLFRGFKVCGWGGIFSPGAPGFPYVFRMPNKPQVRCAFSLNVSVLLCFVLFGIVQHHSVYVSEQSTVRTVHRRSPSTFACMFYEISHE